MLSRKNNNIQKPEEKIKNAVDAIYNATVFASCKTGFAKRRGDTVYKAASVLMNLGYVANRGNKTHPEYYWASENAPSVELYQQVAREVSRKRKENDKKYRKSKKVNSIEISKRTVAETILPEQEPQHIMALALVNFSDQKLWDELKSRGYAIKENKLQKVITLD